jgi:hypothetical protein
MCAIVAKMYAISAKINVTPIMKVGHAIVGKTCAIVAKMCVMVVKTVVKIVAKITAKVISLVIIAQGLKAVVVQVRVVDPFGERELSSRSPHVW